MAHIPTTPTADEIDARIGHNIALRRKGRGLSQTGLARQLGVSFQQVQKYEKGQNRVGGSRLFMIAEALRCSPAALFPPMSWEAGPDGSAAALEECGRLLRRAQGDIAAAVRIAKGKARPVSDGPASAAKMRGPAHG